jgi:RND superfamily putative drug exporter
MATLARWCYRHRRWVVGGWGFILIVVLALSSSLGSHYSSSLTLSGTDSQAAANLLKTDFRAVSGENDQVVIQATKGATIRTAAVRDAVSAALGRVAQVPGVKGIISPYSKEGESQISRDGTIAFATVTWDKASAQITKTDADNLIEAAKTADSGHVSVSLGGQAIETSENPGAGLSLGVGVIAALIVLLIIFGGAILASLMPLLTAIVALAIGTSCIGLLSRLMSVATVSTNLAILIGLGVGVDYGLFIISRHRSAVKSGLSFEDAVAQAATTSGRTVLFAGATVCIALLGQLLLGVSYLYGVSISAALTVALTMAASLTFLPAMLGFLGAKTLSRRERVALAGEVDSTSDVSAFWHRWASVVERRKPIVAVGALAVVVAIALPIFGLRLGSSDASTDASGSTSHQAYTAITQGFGPGYNGPLEVAGEVHSSTDSQAFDHLLTVVAHEQGVASVTPAVTSPNGRAVLATVYPTTSPQAKQTVNLVDRIRAGVIPPAEKGTTLSAHVGGVTATNIDFAHVLTDKLPIFIAVVVLLAFVLLLAVFRSLLIPLVASCMNLLSIGAALGALNAVFNWGWGKDILGLSGTGPISPFLPVLMFSVLFGLSMDYEVYLVSRIQEEWHHLIRSEPGGSTSVADRAARLNHRAILTGQAKSGRIIAGAATIMICVFGSFLLDKNVILKEFGFGLAFSVLVDAFVIRSLLVPAIMHLIGPSNWSMPAWIDRILPNLSVDVEEPSPNNDIEDILPVG